MGGDVCDLIWLVGRIRAEMAGFLVQARFQGMPGPEF